MSDELTIDVVMTRRFELVDEQAVIASRHKQELAPINEELAMCELFIKNHMNETNTQSLNITGAGMAYFTTKSKCSVGDFDAVLAKIRGENLWHMLTKAVSKEAVKDYIKEHGAPPDGIDYSEYRDLSWKRGNA